MKPRIDLPDNLYRQLKARSALEPTDRGLRLQQLLEREVWPNVPPFLTRLTKAEEEAFLGFEETGA